MVYRIHFTSQDLARTRIADRPLPLVELSLAIRAIQDRTQPARLDSWRRTVSAPLTFPMRMVMELVPPVGGSPSFLSQPCTGRPEEALQAVSATPSRMIDADLEDVAGQREMPSWTHHLSGDVTLLKQLEIGLTGLHDRLLRPYWDQVENLLLADRAVRVDQWLKGGVERLLTQVNPRWMRWNPPVLEIRMPNGREHDVVLEGQGVLLVPSVFCARSLVDDTARPQPIVSYPAALDDPLRRLTVFTRKPADTEGAVSTLLGQTRAAVLTLIAEHPGCSTKELARLAGVAPASASEHATVLRRAGLIETARGRHAVRHSATSLGIDLLNAT
ncbi:winged helix-turn-helix domain-containing protein [Actinoallomurus sp. CA-150999]|uniref:winged helix-turn-helix domain-containing protein n=1 Tax=Actinoallomurus sp. CA-150999 TaxID=3239887 RepID=UPI003D90E206